MGIRYKLLSPGFNLSSSSRSYLFSCLNNVPFRRHCDGARAPGAKPVRVTFVDKKGSEMSVSGFEGDNVVHLAHENEIELEGACACSLACSTCHVILDQKVYDSLETPCEEEEDLLDLAFGLTPT